MIRCGDLLAMHKVFKDINIKDDSVGKKIPTLL
jgi:hypothetical protein